MEEKKFTREDAAALLCNKYESIKASGEERFPKRSDFTEREVSVIKSFFGPWPRALEAAGIKEPRDDKKAEKIKEKRICAKRKATEEKIKRKTEITK